MSQTSDTARELSFDEFDELDNPRPETSDFDIVVEEALWTAPEKVEGFF